MADNYPFDSSNVPYSAVFNQDYTAASALALSVETTQTSAASLITIAGGAGGTSAGVGGTGGSVTTLDTTYSASRGSYSGGDGGTASGNNGAGGGGAAGYSGAGGAAGSAGTGGAGGGGGASTNQLLLGGGGVGLFGEGTSGSAGTASAAAGGGSPGGSDSAQGGFDGYFDSDGAQPAYTASSTSSTSSAWSPSDITTYAWFDGDDNTTIYTDTGKTTNATNGQDVQLWADKSGNSRDVQKINISNVPNYNSSGLNSKGILQSNVYDVLEHQLSTNFTSGSWEVYTVVKVNNAAGSTDNYPRIMSFAAGGNDYSNTAAFIPLYYSNVAANFQSWQNSAGGPTVGGYTNGTFRLISARSDSNTAYISADGGTESSTSKAFSANATGFRLFAPVQAGIGADVASAGAASDAFLDGAIAELVFISGNLSSTDKQKLEGYLSHKWGLEGNLPSNHPYKSEAP